jgi:hypothetical protein
MRMRQILVPQDMPYRRNPIHYAAMSKFTKCFKCMEALLNFDLETDLEGYDEFLKLFFELQLLETQEERKFDPRKYQGILGEFRHLMSPAEYGAIVRDFRLQARLLLKEVLDA